MHYLKFGEEGSMYIYIYIYSIKRLKGLLENFKYTQY